MGCSLSIKTDKCPSPFDPDVYLIRQPAPPVETKVPLEIRNKISSTKNPCIKRSPQRKWIRSVSVMDTRCSLTTRDKYQIIKSWKAIARDLHATGITMFLRMFEENVDLRKFFKFGDYKESSDLLQNKIFLNHVTLVMHTFDEAICSMGDTDYVMEMLRGIGKSHRRLPEFNFMIFSRIEEPFLIAVKETLGDRYSVNMDNIYRKTVKFIIRELSQGFNDTPKAME
ncbi:neuroglobin-like isoform X2 [Ostrea edulis]|uniref:neuroglobin-like isoform X2 n=1 Tax=Ostrea edulis TaxID=37623 RepID=UPI0020965BFD|nr:neuroglobin-like isoform X2 [Ostrea edulis]